MEKLTFSSKAVYQTLKEKGVNHLYHANTTTISTTLIQNISLLSRSYVDYQGLNQTP